MTTVPALLVMGHRLCNALLTEAKMAVADGDWADATERLQEFAVRMERHMQAEHEVLFPRLAALSPEIESALTQCRREHEEIGRRTKAALDSARAQNQSRCGEAIGGLVDFLSTHCLAEERFVYALAQDMGDRVVMELAGTLGPATDDTAAPEPPSPDGRLH